MLDFSIKWIIIEIKLTAHQEEGIHFKWQKFSVGCGDVRAAFVYEYLIYWNNGWAFILAIERLFHTDL